MYGTNGENPNEAVVRANKTTRVVDAEPDRACELPTNNLHEVMSQESQEVDQLNAALTGKGTFIRSGDSTVTSSLTGAAERTKADNDVDAQIAELVESLDDEDVEILEKFIDETLRDLSDSETQQLQQDMGLKKSLQNSAKMIDVLGENREQSEVGNNEVYIYQKYLDPEVEAEKRREEEKRKREKELDETLNLIEEILESID